MEKQSSNRDCCSALSLSRSWWVEGSFDGMVVGFSVGASVGMDDGSGGGLEDFSVRVEVESGMDEGSGVGSRIL